MRRELYQYLDELPRLIERELSGIIRNEAEALAEAQRDALRAHLQDPEDTGVLEASVEVVDGAHELEVIVQAGGEATTVDGYDRALAFELGTARQPPRSFFYSTARGRLSGVRDRINDALERLLK